MEEFYAQLGNKKVPKWVEKSAFNIHEVPVGVVEMAPAEPFVEDGCALAVDWGLADVEVGVEVLVTNKDVSDC